MTEQTNSVPKRRFKEFQNTYAWEQRKLKNMLDKVIDNRGKTPPVLDKGKHPMLEVASLGGFLPSYSKVTKFVSNETFNTWFRDYLQEQDVLFSTVGNTGLTSLMDENINAVIAQNIVGFRFIDSFDPNFMVQMFKQKDNLKKVKRIEMGAVQPSVKVSQLVDIKYKVPSFEEQTQIGNFFKQFDETITLQQRKLEKTKALKSAYLSEMFPAEGEREPKRRFAGFTQAWEQRRLGEVADIIGGGTPSTSNEEYWDGDIDWYSPVEIGEQTYVDSSQKKITELGLQKSSAKILPIGTVLFTSRAGIGNTAILAKEGATNQGFQSIVPHKDELDSYFIYSRTHELKRYGETNGAGSTFVEVSGKQMAKMPMLIPTLEEQKKIGGFFERLDHLIALHQRKLEKLQNIKKAYLNEMFV